MAETQTKTYVGDGVYVQVDKALQLVLTTEDGIRETNRIYLNPEVWDALQLFVKSSSVGRRLE